MPDRSIPTSPSWSLPHADRLATVKQTLMWGVRAVGFWLAIATPFLYVPLLLGGLSGRSELFTFGGLVAVNAIALVVGHGYRLNE